MSDLISRSALVNWLKTFVASYTDLYARGYVDGIKRAIDGANELAEEPAIDAVEVCRCKDCKWRAYDCMEQLHYCEHAVGMYGFVSADDFCSYGERKDGADG